MFFSILWMKCKQCPSTGSVDFWCILLYFLCARRVQCILCAWSETKANTPKSARQKREQKGNWSVGGFVTPMKKFSHETIKKEILIELARKHSFLLGKLNNSRKIEEKWKNISWCLNENANSFFVCSSLMSCYTAKTISLSFRRNFGKHRKKREQWKSW